MIEAKTRQRLYAFLPFLLYAVLITVFLDISWMKWGDLIVDSGKEWYVPVQLLSGKVLYRDLAWYYGPLVPYLNALFFKLGGVQIGSLVFSGFLSLILTVYALHHLAKRALGTYEAVLVVSTFILVFAFGFYVMPRNYNFIIPYTYAAPYGLAFALLSVLFFQKAREKAGRLWEGLTVFFLCALLLTRVELGFMTVAAIVMPAILEFKADKNRGRVPLRLSLKVSFLSIGASVLIFFIFFGALFNLETWNLVVGHLLSRGVFEENVSGVNNIAQDLPVWLISAFLYAVFFLIFAGGGYIASKVQGPFRSAKVRISILVTALVTLGLAYYLFRTYFGFPAQYRCLPVLCLIVGFHAAYHLVRGNDPKRQSLVLTLSFLSFVMLLRMFFRVWPGHYGFTLLVPGLVIYTYFFLKWIPSFFSRDRVRLFIRGGFVFLSLLFIYKFVNHSLTGYGKCTLPISSPRGDMFCFPADTYYLSDEFLQYLIQNTQPEETLAVFPEGIGFNFLANRVNPLTDYNYNPVDLSPVGTSTRVMEQLERNHVTYVAIVQRDTSSQGFASFGKDYGTDVMTYIQGNYDLTKVWGAFPYTTNHFGVALFKRKAVLPNTSANK